jgi:hypothetical protein
MTKKKANTIKTVHDKGSHDQNEGEFHQNES